MCKRHKGGNELGVPSAWRLSESIHGLVQTEHLVLALGVNEVRQLMYIDLLDPRDLR